MKKIQFSLFFSLFPFLLSAQEYQVGNIVEDYSFTDYSTGEVVSLYELGEQGGVLVLEWFAWWCPFCANASANVETGIIEHYADRGGNPYGLPVRHVGLNVQGDARANSDTFIQKYNFQTVMEDYDRAFFDLFTLGNGQPLFVVLNAEPNSPSAERWEVLYVRLNYFMNEAPDISALMRPFIDSVMPGTATNPVEEVFPNATQPVDGWYKSEWFGYFEGSSFPFISHLEFGFGYVAPGPEDGTLYFHDIDGAWLFTGQEHYPYLYSFQTGNWLFYQEGSRGGSFFDYASMEWINAPLGS